MQTRFETNVDVSRLHLDADKPTLLLVTDSGCIHSGFAQVVRNLFKRLWDDRDWNIVQYGWWHTDPVESVPWPVISTNRHPDDPRFVDMADKYGEESFERVVGEIKPEMVWVMGDPWMVQPVLKNVHRDTYTVMLYVPIDGGPLSGGWDVLGEADVVVPYLPWGKEMIERWLPDVGPVDPIPHGVDTEIYKPVAEAERRQIRAKDGQLKPDDIFMLSVSRNQGRKNLPALIELTYYIRTGDYRVCRECGRAYRNPYDYRLGRPTGKKGVCRVPRCWENQGMIDEGHMVAGAPHDNFYYYMHTPILDLEAASWRLLDVIDTFGMGVPVEGSDSDVRYPGFRWNENVRIVHGPSEADLAKLYAAADIFSLPTTGEGFGLPIIEAMSCGVPVVVPDVSSHPDFVDQGGGILVDIGYDVCETTSGYYRGYPDLDDYLTKLLLVIEDKGLRLSLGRAAREIALKYDWDVIAARWRDLINEHIGGKTVTRRWQKLTTI